MTSDSAPEPKPYKPSDFLRTRRPERYSDSITIDEPQITQDILEYHLETLTNRSQEKEFEYFARRLAEKELCPNLLPQTGPTGGGDSKVDSETYPVAEQISIRWYQGDAGSKNRWAFAMSAKKDWRGKVKSDVEKIAGTNRGYALIYFITNQFVRDKVRAEVEDKLKAAVGIDVRILDRSWIIDRIINHDGIGLAAQALSIESLQFKPQKNIGPLDAQRKSELEKLDREIKEPERYDGVGYQLAEDCLRSAILASELERNRHEVDGRFMAALRVAERAGVDRQILRIVYHQAWTACFVYDDIAELSRLYDKVEELGLSSQQADDVEMVGILWNVLVGAVGLDCPEGEIFKLQERADAIKKKLEELSIDDTRPNNSLHAKTMLCFHSLHQLMKSKKQQLSLDSTFDELTAILDKSRGLGQYPFDSYKRLIFELGEFITDSDAYEKLFDTVVTIQEERTSEGESGAALTNRGIQKLGASKVYDAIKLFGRAQEKLIKEEYKDELVTCLIACGRAYKASGLHWAARFNLLAALSICITEHSKSGFMHRLALLAAKDLAWIEVELGRVPHLLFSINLTNFITNNLKLSEEETEELYWPFILHIDGILSILLLRANIKQLDGIKKLPYLLDQLNLTCSEGTALFALGQIDELRKGVWFDEEDSIEKIEGFYELFHTQPANEQLPDSLALYLEEVYKIRSNVLGTNLVAKVDENTTSLLIAESIFGALEAFLATSLWDIIPHKQVAKVAFKVDRNLQEEFGIKLISNSNNYELEIAHKDDYELTSAAAIQNFRSLTMKFITTLLPRIATLGSSKDHLERLVEEESAFNRSLTFSDVITLTKNIFGNQDWFNLSELLNSIDKPAYTLNRTKQWQPKKQTEKQTEKPKQPLKHGTGEPPEDLTKDENLKHSERKVYSLIDIPAWDQAKWSGTFFMISPEDQFPPTLGLMFEDEKAAKAIFNGWRDRLGNKDEKDELRISIITGVDKNNPAHYRVHVGSNINAYEPLKEQSQFVMVSRNNSMTPDTDKNLKMFLAAYKKFGVFYLVPAIQKGQSAPEIIRECFLFKRSVIVRPAWQIGDNDDDFIVLHSDDDPIIPTDVKNPPVTGALKRVRKRK